MGAGGGVYNSPLDIFSLSLGDRSQHEYDRGRLAATNRPMSGEGEQRFLVPMFVTALVKQEGTDF